MRQAAARRDNIVTIMRSEPRLHCGNAPDDSKLVRQYYERVAAVNQRCNAATVRSWQRVCATAPAKYGVRRLAAVGA